MRLVPLVEAQAQSPGAVAPVPALLLLAAVPVDFGEEPPRVLPDLFRQVPVAPGEGDFHRPDLSLQTTQSPLWTCFLPYQSPGQPHVTSLR